MRIKQKRVNSEEEVDLVELNKRKKEKKLALTQDRNHINQQKRWERLKKIDIRDSI